LVFAPCMTGHLPVVGLFSIVKLLSHCCSALHFGDIALGYISQKHIPPKI